MKMWMRVCAALALAATMTSGAVADGAAAIGLHYSAELRKVGFPSPVLTAKIGGQEVRFLVDSGAGVHTFAAWFAKAAALKPMSGSNVHAVDSSGNSIDVLIVRDAPLRLSNGSTLDIDEAIVADFPPMFEQLKIAGLLSPQLLATKTQAAIFDLNIPELRFEPMESALEHLHASILSADDMTGVCAQKESPLTNRLYTIRTLVGGVATSLTIDTGATTTSIQDGIPAAHVLRAKPGTGRDQMGVAGKRVRVFQSVPVDVDFGAGPRRLPVGVGPSAGGCGSQGRLGMDALAGCRWVFGSAAFAMSCAK